MFCYYWSYRPQPYRSTRTSLSTHLPVRDIAIRRTTTTGSKALGNSTPLQGFSLPRSITSTIRNTEFPDGFTRTPAILWKKPSTTMAGVTETTSGSIIPEPNIPLASTTMENAPENGPHFSIIQEKSAPKAATYVVKRTGIGSTIIPTENSKFNTPTTTVCWWRPTESPSQKKAEKPSIYLSKLHSHAELGSASHGPEMLNRACELTTIRSNQVQNDLSIQFKHFTIARGSQLSANSF